MAALKKQQSLKLMTPLLLVAGFLSLTELIVGAAATQVSGVPQNVLIVFVCIFPMLVAGAFFYTLWHKPFVFYPPSDFGATQNVGEYVQAMQGRSAQTPSEQFGGSHEVPSKSEGQTIPALTETELDLANAKPDVGTKGSKESDPVMEMLVAGFDGHLEETKNAFSKIQLREKSDAEAKSLEATFAYLRFAHCGDSSGLTDLEKLAEKEEFRSLAWRRIGYAWQVSKNFDKAINAFQIAEESALDNEHRIDAIMGRIESLQRDGQYAVAVECLMKRRDVFRTDAEKAKFFETLGDVFDAKGDMFLKAVCLDKSVSFNPTSSNNIFGAAWAYGEKQMHHLAVLHYDALTTMKKKSSGGFNNLGVECERLHMPIAAVKAYRKALDNEDTLAGANLAYRYLNAGFAEEARALLKDLQKQADVHANVGSAWAALVNAEDAESETMKKVMKKGRSLQKILRDFADAYFRNRGSLMFEGSWALPNGLRIEIHERDNKFEADWIDGDYTMNLIGQIHGAGASITLNKVYSAAKNMPSILSLMGNSEISGFACLDRDGNQLSVFNFDQEDPSILQFTRVHLLSAQT
jgi:tetratricopeptide (TPR) repeat protein